MPYTLFFFVNYPPPCISVWNTLSAHMEYEGDAIFLKEQNVENIYWS